MRPIIISTRLARATQRGHDKKVRGQTLEAEARTLEAEAKAVNFGLEA